MTIFDTLHARKIASIERRRLRLLESAENYRRDATELSLKAYHMDQFATPLSWGRTQNAANFAKHYERTMRAKADDLQAQIYKLTNPQG
jgi:hypothetical protein